MMNKLNKCKKLCVNTKRHLSNKYDFYKHEELNNFLVNKQPPQYLSVVNKNTPIREREFIDIICKDRHSNRSNFYNSLIDKRFVGYLDLANKDEFIEIVCEDKIIYKGFNNINLEERGLLTILFICFLIGKLMDKEEPTYTVIRTRNIFEDYLEHKINENELTGKTLEKPIDVYYEENKLPHEKPEEAKERIEKKDFFSIEGGGALDMSILMFFFIFSIFLVACWIDEKYFAVTSIQ